MGMRPYVIRPGDYLTQLAFRFGFDADQVWNAPENEALRRVRPQREMLAPGDVLQIPDEPAPRPSVRIGSQNRFRARVPTVEVRLELRDQGRGLANEPYRVEGLARPVTGQSDGEGHVKVQVPVTAREVQVALPGLHMVVPVRVGHLDPPATTSGARQRLDHLGYHRPTGAGPDDDARALRQFQRDHGLPETGEADEATRRALEDAHRS